MYQAGYPGLHKSQESFPVQVLSAGNTKGWKRNRYDTGSLLLIVTFIRNRKVMTKALISRLFIIIAS